MVGSSKSISNETLKPSKGLMAAYVSPRSTLTSFLTLIKFFNLSGIPAGVLLIQSCMPSAILCYLIAHMYSPKEIVDNISSTIVVSTIMSLFTIPITLFFALKYFY